MASLIGKEIGKYRITERIGRGGMAEVYLGTHILLDRPVAIKVLHGFLLEGGDFIERFKREAKAVANLRHPNIVQVYDFDIRDEIIFMVMEYIDGTNLQKELVELGEKGDRFPITQIGSVINDIASALDYAHSQGMLHRDVKPSNIMIDKEGNAYLTDFGIARIVSDQKLTATGTLMGTPAYMSPEQGRGEELTEESDIYSLGIIAFELLTGQVPYDAKTPIGIIHKQISDPIPDITKMVKGVSVSAQEVINRALAKSPKVRYSSADELVSALRIALEALESSDLVTKEPPSTEIDEESLTAPTMMMEDEPQPSETQQPTVIMEEEEIPASEDEPGPSDFVQPTVVMEEGEASQPEEELEQEVELELETESVLEGLEEADKAQKRKIPVWGWIVAGIVLVGMVVVVLTQFIDLPIAGLGPEPTRTTRPTSTTHPEPTAEPTETPDIVPNDIDMVFNSYFLDAGLTLLSGDNRDTEIYMEGEDQAWRSGSGKVLKSSDGNTIPDFNFYFDVDDNQIFNVPKGALIRIDVQYSDFGTDSFNIEYDTHSGDEIWKSTEVVQKSGSGGPGLAVFFLEDAYFSNRLNGADFVITDNADGPETIWMVRLKLFETMSGEEYYDKAVALEEADLGAKADIYYEAIQYYDAAIAAGYETSVLYGNQAWAYVKLGEPEEAMKVLDRAIAFDPEDPEIRVQRGDIFWWHLQDAENAQIEFDLAIALDDSGAHLYNMRGLFYLETGKYELCVEDYTMFFSLDPTNAWAPLERGHCYAGLGDVDSARQDYETFLTMTEGNPDWKAQRGPVQSWLLKNK